MEHFIPQGFTMAGFNVGIKKASKKPDLTMVVSETAAVAAGVYTQNLVFAAPVALDRQRTPSDAIRAVVVNSGNANACTGERGMNDARRMAELTENVLDAPADSALVMSTGIIGEFLPMEKIEAGIQSIVEELGPTWEHFEAAAQGIMTTDTVMKTVSRSVKIAGQEVRLAGMAKGAGMIGPNMATMLGLVMTDARLTPEVAQAALQQATDDSFNCISVEGHMSTNDTVLLLANGHAVDEPLTGENLETFQTALNELCIELARQIPEDGEGATHLVTIDVVGCQDKASARKIAKVVAESALVKTAITGADPNWGRIVSAAGYAGVDFDPSGVGLAINGFTVFEKGAPTSFDAEAVSAAMEEHYDTHIELTFTEGDASARFWTTDLTVEYIHINADYHT
ncbi:MAG: bifunctional glutamate N-acetyltransferase/amino-acid acetyltransferase ArgJ [Planctomycetia bacterium]|jgi:glutamate N-acetyltransferase/amino-acid N-acetyltransferase